MPACPDIFLGYDPNASPPNIFWENLAITPGLPVTSGYYPLQIAVGNKGNAFAEGVKVRLFWSPPTTGFLAEQGRRLPDITANVPPQSVPSGPGLYQGNVVFDGTIAAPYSGHLAFMAQAWMPYAPGGGCTQQIYDAEHPETDPRTAIWNVHLAKQQPAMGSHMYYGFAASNPRFERLENTRLRFKQLNSNAASDQAAIDHLTSSPMIDYQLTAAGVNGFAPAGQVWVRRGVQQAVSPTLISPLGPLSPQQGEASGGGSWMPINQMGSIDLQPREQVQVLLKVTPSKAPNVAHAIQITHLTCDERRLGGITLIFVPRKQYYPSKADGM